MDWCAVDTPCVFSVGFGIAYPRITGNAKAFYAG